MRMETALSCALSVQSDTRHLRMTCEGREARLSQLMQLAGVTILHGTDVVSQVGIFRVNSPLPGLPLINGQQQTRRGSTGKCWLQYYQQPS